MKNNTSFKEINPSKVDLNFINLLPKVTCLITAKSGDRVNTMTIGWAEIGYLWYRPVVTTYVRDSRYTLEFTESSDYFSLCFFDETYKDKLIYLGRHSGRDEDKISKVGLTTKLFNDVPYFEEASTVLICKKIYRDHINENNFVDKEVYKRVYADNLDFHYRYVAEIVNVLKKEEDL
jgi:flavin reductase (DIM6/NTAB) family NADH-FMN oxidoreductase RutF